MLCMLRALNVASYRYETAMRSDELDAAEANSGEKKLETATGGM